MKVKRILLTGDDGYNSVGTRLLIHALKDTYDLQIAATKNQQSGVGGKISLTTGGKWGEDVVDGVPAFWVEGTPADVMECSEGFFKEPFDLLISGVNLGANVTSAVISSGTYSAAVRGMGLNLAAKGMAISWDAPQELYHLNHNQADDISRYIEYPGGVLRTLIEKTLSEDFWGVNLLNINLPKQPTNQAKFTKILKDVTRYYSYPIVVDAETHRFSYERELFNIEETDLKYDSAALSQGYISITPCAFDMTHFTTFQKLANLDLDL